MAGCLSERSIESLYVSQCLLSSPPPLFSLLFCRACVARGPAGAGESIDPTAFVRTRCKQLNLLLPISDSQFAHLAQIMEAASLNRTYHETLHPR
jgi:hypothetical protein